MIFILKITTTLQARNYLDKFKDMYPESIYLSKSEFIKYSPKTLSFASINNKQGYSYMGPVTQGNQTI